MRIAQITPLTEAVPPKLYGGTERVISLADRRTRRAWAGRHAVCERRFTNIGAAQGQLATRVASRCVDSRSDRTAHQSFLRGRQ